MKRRLPILFSTALLAACATAQQQDSARAAWGTCIAREVDRLDDGKTDPVSIAYGVAPQCAALYNELTQAAVRQYYTEAGQANMRAEMRNGELRLVTAAVVTRRAARRL